MDRHKTRYGIEHPRTMIEHMRVLHFFKTYWPDTFGGVERTIHAIAKGTAALGIQSDVLSLSKNPKEGTVNFDGHMAYKAKLDFEFASTGFSREVLNCFRELSRRADIVHYHFPWPMNDLMHRLVDHKKPSIVTYHSDIVKQKFLLKLYRPFMNNFLGDVDKIVATSPNYLQTSPVLQRYRSKTQVIPLGLDESDYPRSNDHIKASWRRRISRPFFLFVGVLRYYKGLQILLEAAALTNFDIVIVGEGPMGEALKNFKATQGVRNVTFLGAVSDADKNALLELSVGLVFPSHLRSEAFGLSLVEASMFGKPMISCEIGTGTSFVNLDGITGKVVPPGDPRALAVAMNTLGENEARAELLGLAARRRYDEHFTAKRMSADYFTLYQEAFAQHKDLHLRDGWK